MKRQATNWEKILGNHILTKVCFLEYIKKSQSSTVKTINQLEQIKQMSRHSTKEDLQMANKYMIKCSTKLAIKKVQNKATVRYHYTSARTAEMETFNIECWLRCKETIAQLLLGGM